MARERIDSARTAVNLWTVDDNGAADRSETPAPENAPIEPKFQPASAPSVARNPLDAAFRGPRLSTLVTENLNEPTEQEVLRRQGPSLVAYGRFDPRARPVVLVHGMSGSGEEMTTLADRLSAEGRQVYVYQYNDRGDFTTVSGEHLARELRGLYARTQQRDQPLDIVAHSMGGIVSRVALNTLAQAGDERGGFPSVRVHTLDTPLAGYPHEVAALRWTNPVARAAMVMGGVAGFYDMRASSTMFEGLYATDLANVTFSNTTARSMGTRGVALNMNDFGDVDRGAIAAYFTDGTLPDDPKVRNYARGLDNDVAGPLLRRALRRELDTQLPAQAMQAAFDAVMPQVDADHGTIVTDPDSAAVDNIIRSITRWPMDT